MSAVSQLLEAVGAAVERRSESVWIEQIENVYTPLTSHFLCGFPVRVSLGFQGGRKLTAVKESGALDL